MGSTARHGSALPDGTGRGSRPCQKRAGVGTECVPQPLALPGGSRQGCGQGSLLPSHRPRERPKQVTCKSTGQARSSVPGRPPHDEALGTEQSPGRGQCLRSQHPQGACPPQTGPPPALDAARCDGTTDLALKPAPRGCRCSALSPEGMMQLLPADPAPSPVACWTLDASLRLAASAPLRLRHLWALPACEGRKEAGEANPTQPNPTQAWELPSPRRWRTALGTGTPLCSPARCHGAQPPVRPAELGRGGKH